MKPAAARVVELYHVVMMVDQRTTERTSEELFRTCPELVVSGTGVPVVGLVSRMTVSVPEKEWTRLSSMATMWWMGEEEEEGGNRVWRGSGE